MVPHMRPAHFITPIGPVLAVLALLTGCEKKAVGHSDGGGVNVSFPLGKRTVHALADYWTDADSSASSAALQFLQIYSMQFDSVRTSGDTLFYRGTVRSYSPASPSLLSPPDSGSVVVSIDKRWVLFQNSGVPESYRLFMKRAGNGRSDADTTAVPSLAAAQFPVFPRGPEPRTSYSIRRPDLDDSYTALDRIFTFGDPVSGSDAYGPLNGLSFSCLQVLQGMDIEMRFTGIMDAHGVVASQWGDTLIATRVDPSSVNGYTDDTLAVRRMNRRLADFSDPASLQPLSWYADRVMREGLEPLE